MTKNRAKMKHEPSRFKAVAYLISLVFLALVSTGVVGWFLYHDILNDRELPYIDLGGYGGNNYEAMGLAAAERERSAADVSGRRYSVSQGRAGARIMEGKGGRPTGWNHSERVARESSGFASAGSHRSELEWIASSESVGAPRVSGLVRHIADRLVSDEDETGGASSGRGGFVKLPEAQADTLLALGKRNVQIREKKVRSQSAATKRTSAVSPLPEVFDRKASGKSIQPVRVEVARHDPIPFTETPVRETEGLAAIAGGAKDRGMFTLGYNDGQALASAVQPAQQPVQAAPQKIQPLRRMANSTKKAPAVASGSAYANPYGKPLDADDLFSLKLHAIYGTSKADFEDESLGNFEDRFLVLGGKKKIDFAGMDTMDIAFDGVITTSGTWDTDVMRQNLSGATLSVGPEFKLPELPIKFETNLGVGWLKREAKLFDDDDEEFARADINSFVYGGGFALRGDWQWRMVKMQGLAGVQYAAANEKSHQFRYQGGAPFDDEIPKTTYSSWELPLQLRADAEYRLLDALTVSPALWGGYTYNISGKNGPFHSGHLAGAQSTWRRNGVTWNDSHWNLGGEIRFNIVDRINLWFDFQKEWAGDNSGKYFGGGLRIAF